MGSIGSNRDGTKSRRRKFEVDIGDTQHLEFDSHDLPHSGEENDDIFYGVQCLEKTQPLLGDTHPVDDAFETQVLDFNAETQVLDLAEETQVVDSGEETQVLDNEEDCGSDVETQLLADPDDGETVGESDEEDTIETEVLNDVQDSDETDSIKNNSSKALGSKEKQETYICNQEKAKSKSVGSVHSAGTQRTPGSVRRGFTSIRTASLRASGLSARKKAVKDVETKVSDHNGLESSSRLFDEAVHQESDMGRTNEHSNSKLERSSERKMSSNDLAGLSYINSQEPGDLSQANALDFVDQFLKENVCDFDLAARPQHITFENQIPILSAKGTQKLAKTVNRTSSLSKTVVYKWDNRLEDEGGGDFLSRNKELLFGKNSGAHKQGKSKNKCKTAKGLAHSEPTIASVRKVDQVEKLNIRRDLNSEFEKQVETEAIDVGVDTQMAAEAIEILSKGEERVFEADLGLTTRSKRTKQSKKSEVVKGKAVIQVENTVQVAKNVKEVHGKKTLNVKEKVKNTARKRNMHDNGSLPAKKRCSEKKINYVAPIASRTRNVRRATISPANAALELLIDPKTKSDGNKRKRKNAEVDATQRVQNRSDQLKENTKSKGSLEESAKQEQSITKKRRSNRRVLPRPNLPSIEHENTELNSVSACCTPVNLKTPIVSSSPVCMGDEYYKRSCNTNLTKSSLRRELNSLTPSEPKLSSPDKGLRKRRDISSVKVLFSHHLNEDIIRQQKKILARLGATAVSSIPDATHFVADEFVRTRNMLEAIAHSKPVVNYLWLERCGQAGCYVDDKKYLLRDVKKEKELGFSMPDSLARASQHPLLEGKRVLITPNTMPGVEILSSLVKAVHGQALERICRSIYKGDKLHDNLIVLSCEEDYEFCLPLLKKGAEVYSSELLLNGIVTQKVELERHRLFMDQVKKTRSTIWLKTGGKEFQAVNRSG